jgi:hypothetical protein
MNIHSQKFLDLLRGKNLVLEIISDNLLERTWIELGLLSFNLVPLYPLNLPSDGMGMLYHSKFLPCCPPEKAAFRLRFATYSVKDIDNGYDPDDRKVGKYIEIPSVSDLDDFLNRKNLSIDDFSYDLFTDNPGWP